MLQVSNFTGFPTVTTLRDEETERSLISNFRRVLMFFAFFWVIQRWLNFIYRRFGTLCLFHLHRQVGVDREMFNGRSERM